MIHDIIYDLLNMTAWRMDVPELFGSFHAVFALLVAAAAAIAAVFTSRSIKAASSAHAGRCLEAAMLSRVLCATGWLLALTEIYKQLFLYYIIENEIYDWWYFPFQLCSVPMYLCIILPFVRGRLRQAFLTFMSGYTFVSAAAALIFPQDFLRSYITLTLHGFIWHGLLLFISLVILLSGSDAEADPVHLSIKVSIKGKRKKPDISASDFPSLSNTAAEALLSAALLFAVLCMIAVCINVAVEPLMQSAHASVAGFAHEYAAMFYLNPFHISPQPIVSNVQKALGIPAGLVLYALTIAIVSSAVALIGRSLVSGCQKKR